MKKRFDFLYTLLQGAGPTPELLGAFSLGLFVVGILSNLAYDLTIAPGEVIALAWRPVLASLTLTGGAYFLYWRHEDRLRRNLELRIIVSRLAPPRSGLIWVLSPQIEHLLVALEHHETGGGAGHCWLIMQSNLESIQQAFDDLVSEVRNQGLKTQLHPVYIKKLDAESAYDAARMILGRLAAEAGLAPDEVVADITGGTKPLTAGMILAALTANVDMEYVESSRDESGDVIPGTQRVVLVDTQFYLSHQQR